MFSTLKKSLLNIPGFRTRRKIVVFESDDWGSVRMPSQTAFTRLSDKGVELESSDSFRYNKYDTVESCDDLSALFETLRSFTGSNGRQPVITAFSLVANPDFEKIQKNNFESYHYETVPATFKRYYPSEDVFSLWKHGIDEGIFVPQFHGREHLNVKAWMDALQQEDRETRAAFNEGVWGFNNRHRYGISYQAAFDLQSRSEVDLHRSILSDGLTIFEHLMGYKASVFVPPNGILNENLYSDLMQYGIRYLFSSKMHRVPEGEGKFKTRIHFIGNRSPAGQRFIIRNAFFEPSTGDHNSVSKCMKDIETAFAFRKPAVISTHRVNFIGRHYEKNRKEGLRQLSELLRGISKKWPDVEFLTSHDLGELMNS
jgi:hypothetical protein